MLYGSDQPGKTDLAGAGIKWERFWMSLCSFQAQAKITLMISSLSFTILSDLTNPRDRDTSDCLQAEKTKGL